MKHSNPHWFEAGALDPGQTGDVVVDCEAIGAGRIAGLFAGDLCVLTIEGFAWRGGPAIGVVLL